MGIQIFGDARLRVFQLEDECPNIGMLPQQIMSPLIALQSDEEARNHLMPVRNRATASCHCRFRHFLKYHLQEHTEGRGAVRRKNRSRRRKVFARLLKKRFRPIARGSGHLQILGFRQTPSRGKRQIVRFYVFPLSRAENDHDRRVIDTLRGIRSEAEGQNFSRCGRRR